MASTFPPELRALVAARLPNTSVYTYHYLTTPSTACDPIFAAPPGAAPEPTTWECVLLSVSIRHQAALVQVFAIEALVYTTARLTTIFVSKADSTGCLHLANLPKTGTSPIRSVASAFLEYLVNWKRSSRRLVLSLFARAQAQYLFPGSAENEGKHVLDDRQLIRWWCRILDDVLATLAAKDGQKNGHPASTVTGANEESVQGYLAIPGLDAHETRSYVPRGSPRWLTRDPLHLLATSGQTESADSAPLPERALIPRFPDDPKARFALDLDGELPENAIQTDDNAPAPEASKTGKWRSVRSLAQFWELMAFRQECAAGRVVGFLWGVFAPLSGVAGKLAEEKKRRSEEANGALEGEATQSKNKEEPSADVLAAKSPPPLADVQSASSAQIATPPTALHVSATTYSIITSLMEQLDYADLTLCKTSTARFITNAMRQAGLSSEQDEGKRKEANGVELKTELNGANGDGLEAEQRDLGGEDQATIPAALNESAWGIDIKGEMEETAPIIGHAQTNEKSDASKPAATPAQPMMLVGRKRKKAVEPATAEKADEKQEEAEKRVKAS